MKRSWPGHRGKRDGGDVLDDVALDYDGPDALLPLERPATATTAIIKSRFTNFSFG